MAEPRSYAMSASRRNIVDPALAQLRPRASLSILLPLILLIPPFVFYLDLASSMALGACAAAVIVISASIPQRRCGPNAGNAARFTIGAMALVILTIIALHITIAALIRPINLVRAGMSLVPLTLILFSGYSLGYILTTARSVDIERAVYRSFALMCMVGLLAIIGFMPTNSGAYFKPVFPFTEPSYFALAILPLLMYCSVSLTGGARVVVLLVGLAIGLALQSLTLMAGLLLIALICLRNAMIPLLLASIGLLATQLDLSYYLDRLDFIGEVQNLSSLVYLQGWQLIVESLTLSAGWGLGFQQLGIQGSDVGAADLIFAMLGDNSNLLDGGFAFAKLTSEFGLLGLLLMFLYFRLAWRAMKGLRQKSRGTSNESPAITLAQAIVACFLVEFFVRGAGYFSGTTLLLAAAVMTLLTQPSVPLGDLAAAKRQKGPHHRPHPDAVRISDLDFQRNDDRASVGRTT